MISLVNVNPENKNDIETNRRSAYSRFYKPVWRFAEKHAGVNNVTTCVKADVTSVLLLRDGLADVCITSTEEIVGGNEEPVRHQISCGTQCEL